MNHESTSRRYDARGTAESRNAWATRTIPTGRQGCCAVCGSVEPSHACSGYDSDASVYVRVDQPSGDACLAYQLSYRI